MANIEQKIALLERALSDWRKHSLAYPLLAEHGFLERTANGYKCRSADDITRYIQTLLERLRNNQSTN